jgi:hypothetical protein
MVLADTGQPAILAIVAPETITTDRPLAVRRCSVDMTFTDVIDESRDIQRFLDE